MDAMWRCKRVRWAGGIEPTLRKKREGWGNHGFVRSRKSWATRLLHFIIDEVGHNNKEAMLR
jgi:hypothetical protein